MGHSMRGQYKLSPAGATHDPNQHCADMAIFIVNNDGSLTDLSTFIEETQAGGVAMMGLLSDLEDRVTALES